MDLAMHRLLMGLFGGSVTLKTVTLPAGTTSWTAPAGVTQLSVVRGKGSDGSPAEDYYVWRYTRQQYINYTVRHDGSTYTTAGATESFYGFLPADYCNNPPTPTPEDPTFSHRWSCYYHTDTSYWDTKSATNGVATTGFGKTFPGGFGAGAVEQVFTDVPVTPGQSYPLSIPSNGYIVISYYE